MLTARSPLGEALVGRRAGDEIELTLEGEKDPLKLTVGGPSAADKGYFAISNRLPGDVFVVPEDRFKKALLALQSRALSVEQ